MLIVLMDLLVYCSNSLPSSSLQRKINALTEKPRVFLNNQEMMAAMMEGPDVSAHAVCSFTGADYDGLLKFVLDA